MRTPTMLLVLAFIAGATPVASAAPSSLTLQLQEGPLAANADVPVNVTLTMDDFMCHEPHALSVALTTTTSDGVKATFERSNLTFEIPARSYFVDSYSEVQAVNLTVRALQAGQVELVATFAPVGEGPCFVPGSFEPSTVIVNVTVTAPTETLPPPTQTTPPPAANETDRAVPPTPVERTPTACGPDATCAPVGEYAAPEESVDRDAPGAGWLAIVAVVGLAAIAWRRRAGK